MGRAIVRDPKVFLFDEPLSNLDAKLRVAMRAEIKALHQRLKTTTVYVTHDQVEAMTMADRIVVMHDGRIEQIGTPLDAVRPSGQPVRRAVHRLAGDEHRQRHAAAGRRQRVRRSRRWGALAARAERSGGDGQAVAYGVRPEHLTLAAAARPAVPAEIIVVEPTGAETELLRAGRRGAGHARDARPAAGQPGGQDRAGGGAGRRAPVRPEDRAADLICRELAQQQSASCAPPNGSAATTATALVHRSWMKNQGIPHDQFDGRPVIGICNTWSQATPCNAHFRELAEHVRSGVLDAGGFPIEFPVMSLGETLMRPTTMLFRNQAAMDVEESIRANPFDGVVLMMGCDKTTPSLLMGAASCDLPTIGRFRRADAQRQVPRRGHRLGHARVEIHRDAQDRRDEANPT